MACAGLITYFYFATTLPKLPDLATYNQVAATTTTVRAWDGTPLAEDGTFVTQRNDRFVVAVRADRFSELDCVAVGRHTQDAGQGDGVYR